MCQQESVDVKIANKMFSVNVADMTAINTDTYKVHLVLRTEMTVKEFPGKWDITEDENFQKVKIDVDSLEYVSVERRFNETLSNKTVTKIERIENKTLWKRFSLDISGEVKLLFYGVKHADVKQVEKTGFFRPRETFFNSENTYGRGIYFYVDASSAQRRCDVNTSGQKVMFLGRAETGTFTVGRKGINVPPSVDPSNPGILYHSVVDNNDNPTVFVMFSSDRTYPEYCITFTD
ncbi:protein mono-ADP-ribosyltransferase PARP15-like [Tachysurus fulvidraco]|uniref:protein mono-ADP-ribosyltransferase PARP15-like n=1 Tax=Tachysurus fulvidraco TaxID=1234273 RepID=UPI001FED7E60|nr:protein mono-ADP-ribosyltransferase PARP15-like [Tachysurus fulvidraco]